MLSFLAASGAVDGSGIRPVIDSASSGLVPQVTIGVIDAASRLTSRSKTAPSSLGTVRQNATALSQSAAFGEKGLDYLDWLSKQELKPGKDGQPYKNDIIRNEIIQEILLESEALAKGTPDEIPF